MHVCESYGVCDDACIYVERGWIGCAYLCVCAGQGGGGGGGGRGRRKGEWLRGGERLSII